MSLFKINPTCYLMLVVFLVFQPLGVSQADSDLPASAATVVKLLRQGGYTLYFRHEQTDWSQSDNIRQAQDWLSCDGSRVRQLSDSGRQRATTTGKAIRALGIPVGQVLASPYCRTMETARLMDLGPVVATTEVINMRVADYFGGRQTIIETAKTLLAKAPLTGSNRIIVSHGNVARNATAIYPDEGEAIIFESDGNGGFYFLGRLTAEAWEGLAVE